MNERTQAVCVAVQQGLLGEVSARLRKVYVAFDDTSIHMNCYFDGEVDDDDRDSMGCVETEVYVLFPNNHTVTHAVIRLDYPAPVPQDGIFCAYSRRESWSEAKRPTWFARLYSFFVRRWLRG